MKKFLIAFFFFVALALPLAVAQAQVDPCNQADPPLGCPGNPGNFPTPQPATCQSTGKPVPVNGVCPPANTTSNTSSGSGSTSSGGGLPECTDNYNTAQICLPKPPIGGKLTGSTSVVQLAAEVIRILLYFSGVVAVIFVIIGGYQYMTAGGNEETASKGRRSMTQAIIGLVIVILSYVIITAVTNYLTK